MKRFHVHVGVADLEQSIAFYTKLFGAEPVVVKSDYAKWMLDDPRVNFAISARGAAVGVNHLGVQVDSEAELAALRGQAAGADLAVLDEPAAACCYAQSNKHWIEDPSGIPWETFQTLGEIPVFGDSAAAAASPAQAVCCAPQAESRSVCCG